MWGWARSAWMCGAGAHHKASRVRGGGALTGRCQNLPRGSERLVVRAGRAPGRWGGGCKVGKSGVWACAGQCQFHSLWIRHVTRGWPSMTPGVSARVSRGQLCDRPGSCSWARGAGFSAAELGSAMSQDRSRHVDGPGEVWPGGGIGGLLLSSLDVGAAEDKAEPGHKLMRLSSGPRSGGHLRG